MERGCDEQPDYTSYPQRGHTGCSSMQGAQDVHGSGQGERCRAPKMRLCSDAKNRDLGSPSPIDDRLHRCWHIFVAIADKALKDETEGSNDVLEY